MSFFSTLKQGQRYLTTWVLKDKLGMIFPENRVIKATLFAQKFMPFVAVFSIVWQQLYMKSAYFALVIAILTALFSLCLPLQGLYWLGKRAQTLLSAGSVQWFAKIYTQVHAQDDTLFPYPEKPTYYDLACLLRKAEQKLPSSFWDEI